MIAVRHLRLLSGPTAYRTTAVWPINLLSMKNVGVYIAIASICAAGGANAENQTCAQAPAEDPLTAPAPAFMPYPNFCDIPPAPKSVPSAAAFKTDVVGVRIAGRTLDTRSGPDTWSLAGTETFAAHAKREVEPPPPMTTPEPGDTEAFVEKSQAQTTPPPRHRRPRH